MKAFLIDPFVLGVRDGTLVLSKEPPIREVEYSGDISEIYKHLSTPKHPVSAFDAARFGPQDCVYVDDEGLFSATHFIMVAGETVPLAGRGFVLGTGPEGESTAPNVSFEDLWVKTRICVGNLSVRLSGIPLGDRVTTDHIQLLPCTAVRVWAEEFGIE